MPDYQKMYYTLFNAMSESTQIMLEAMQKAEEIYIESDHAPIILADSNGHIADGVKHGEEA